MAAASKRKTDAAAIAIEGCRRTDFSDYRHWKTGADGRKRILLFYTANGHAGYKVSLQEGIKQNDGKHRHHSSGGTHGNRRDGCGSGVAAGGGTAALLHDRGKKLHQLILQGRILGVHPVVQHSIEPGVPLSDSYEQGDGGIHRLAQGRDDTGKDGEIVGTVNHGGFFQRAGQTFHESAHNQNVKCADHARNDVYPERVGQVHVAVQNQGGDHTAVHVHGDDPEQRQLGTEQKAFAADDVGQKCVRYQGEDGSQHSSGHRNHCTGEDVLLMQNRFIVRERKDARPQMDATAYGVDTVVERKRHRVQNRIQRNGDEQNQENGIAGNKDFVHGG